MKRSEMKVILKVPQLYKSKIMKLIDEHNSEVQYRKNPFPYDDIKDTLSDLERLLVGDTTGTLSKYLLKLQEKDILIDKYTPKEIINNIPLMEKIIRSNPDLIGEIPLELIPSQFISVYEKIMNELNPNLYVYSIPNSFFLEDSICDLFFSRCLDYGTYNILLEKIAVYNSNYLDKAFDIGLKKGFKIQFYYNDNFIVKLFSSDKYINLIEDNSLTFAVIEKLYFINKELSKKVFMMLLDNNKFNLKSEGIPYFNLIPDKDLIQIIFDYDIFELFRNHFDRLDISLLNPKMIEKLLLSKNELLGLTYKTLKSIYSSVEYLPVFIRLKPEAISLFDINIINDYVSSLDTIDDINNVIIKYALDCGLNNPGKLNSSKLLKSILMIPNPKDLNLRSNMDFVKYLYGFSKESFTDENLDLLFELQKIYGKRENFYIFQSLNIEVLTDKRIFNYLLEKTDSETVKYLLIFDKSVFDENSYKIIFNKLNEIDNIKGSIVLSNSLLDGPKTKEIVNILFNKLSLSDFIETNPIKFWLGNDFGNIINLIELNEENIEKVMLSLEDYFHINHPSSININEDNNKVVSMILWILHQIEEKPNLKSMQLDYFKDILLHRVNMELSKFINNHKLINDYILKTKNGKLNPFNYFYVKNNEKCLEFMTYLFDISSNEQSQYASSVPKEIINKINIKHLSIIRDLLIKLNVRENNLYKLAINIYMTIGYERAVDLLTTNPQKNYGVVDENILNEMFNNINLYDTLFEEKGNGYVPKLNEQLINIIFGKNNKIKNTPIRNFLNNYSDKEEEINRNIERLKKDLSLTPEERETKISEYQKQLETYKDNIKEFFKNIGKCFIEWDIIEEEFIKKQNKSKLELKINISSILDILKNIKSIRGDLDDVRDAKLIESDVFEYVGYDTQYTTDPERAPLRAVTLSRQMEDKYIKKIPNISISKGKYTIRVYHPQDRRLLSAGYRSGCCFRPNGNADNMGENNSLLRYCATNEYGGGVEIVDNEGNTIMFSPLLRNGNVLMIHSIETTHSPIPSECNELLKEFADKVIDESTKNGDNISYVVITDLHYLDTSITEGTLSTDKKFKVYDPTGEYAGMYNNLDRNHMILSHSKEKKVDDISYGEVTSSYQFEKEKVFNQFEVNNELVLLCSNLDSLKNEIIVLSNKRQIKLKKGKEEESFELLKQIKEKKATYNSIYKQVLDMKKGKDYYKETKNIIYVFSKYCKDLNFTDLVNYSQIMYSSDWYIAIRTDGIVEYNCLDSGYDELLHYLRNLKETSNYVIKNEELLSK